MTDWLSSVPIDAAHMAQRIRLAMEDAARAVSGRLLREAVANAPVSPTVTEHSSTLVRKRRTKTRHEPGGLEKSITAEVRGQGREVEVACFVPTSSPAKDYADYIHNKRYIKWWNRGKGTRDKGDRAREKFIERARDTVVPLAAKKFARALDYAMKGMVK